jgi:hypothetical protein
VSKVIGEGIKGGGVIGAPASSQSISKAKQNEITGLVFLMSRIKGKIATTTNKYCKKKKKRELYLSTFHPFPPIITPPF